MLVTSASPKEGSGATAVHLAVARPYSGRRLMMLRALLLFLVAVTRVKATLEPPLSLHALTRQADRIVQGRIAASHVTWGPEHRLIWTHYDLSVDGALKGPRDPKLTFSVPGGVLGTASMSIPGTPHFIAGEQVILFLRRTPIGYLCTVGFSQGCFRISAGQARNGTAAALSITEFKQRVAQTVGHREVH